MGIQNLRGWLHQVSSHHFPGMRFLATSCAASHEKEALCCKAGEEILQYYRETANLTRDQNPFKLVVLELLSYHRHGILSTPRIFRNERTLPT